MSHAIEWLNVRGRDDREAVQAWVEGLFGDPVAVAKGLIEVQPRRPRDAEIARRFADILVRARLLIAEEKFLNWEVAFPGVRTDWEGAVEGGPAPAKWSCLKYVFCCESFDSKLCDELSDREIVKPCSSWRSSNHAPKVPPDHPMGPGQWCAPSTPSTPARHAPEPLAT